nr:YciI family protein [Aquimarina longa]
MSLTYKVSLETIDSYLDLHIKYLNEQYELQNFIASGRKTPRTGGIILSKISEKNELLKILDKDPFKINGLADYDITEFIPNKTCEELKFLME